MSELVISLLAMALGCASLGVTIIIAQEQGRIRKNIETEKKDRRKQAAFSFTMALFDLHMNFEHVALEKNTILPNSDKTMMEKSVRFFKETRLLYYSDLNAEIIQKSELVINHIELWIASPCYTETMPNVSISLQVIKYPYETIEGEIIELDDLLTSIYKDGE